MNRNGFSYQVQIGLKRLVDILTAVVALLIWFPIFVGFGIAIRLDSPGPILYRHRRIGKDGRPFSLYKFRTMVTGGDDSGYMNYLRELIESEKNSDGQGLAYKKLDYDPRVTRIGKFLRCYYLDELPQFINIFKGEMSLVGPRPHVQFEVDNYTPRQQRRLTVKPGATGLWQVAGKADCTFSELIELDLEYIDNWTPWLDMSILAMTFTIFFQGGEGFWTRMSKHIPNKIEASFRRKKTQIRETNPNKKGADKVLSCATRETLAEGDTPYSHLPSKE